MHACMHTYMHNLHAQTCMYIYIYIYSMYTYIYICNSVIQHNVIFPGARITIVVVIIVVVAISITSTIIRFNINAIAAHVYEHVNGERFCSCPEKCCLEDVQNVPRNICSKGRFVVSPRLLPRRFVLVQKRSPAHRGWPFAWHWTCWQLGPRTPL